MSSFFSHNQKKPKYLFFPIQPKSRSTASQPSTPWNGANNASNTLSLQDIQRQQSLVNKIHFMP